MSEARIGRLLAASLHQAIADELPARLEFYENWLTTQGLRGAGIGLSAFGAVLSFLRREGGVAYELVTTRAGGYAADWTLADMSGVRQAVLRGLPVGLRSRLVLRAVRAVVQQSTPGTRALARYRRRTAELEIRGSHFCEVRTGSPRALCGFYAAVIARMFRHFGLEADVRADRCRATGAESCCLALVVQGAPAATSGPAEQAA